MRKIYDINEFIDIMSNIKDGCFATVCYLSSAKVKKTLRGVDTNAFGADLDANRTEGDDEYYNTLKQYQSGSIKKFPYNGVVKMSKIQFHWQSEEKYGENYGKYASARDALIGQYGGEPVRRDGTDSKQAYGNGSVSIGNTDNTQGKLYSHQNGATIQNIQTEYFLVDTNGQLKGGISKEAIQNIVAKSSDADGVSALRKVNATDEQIASYVEELKKLKFRVLKLMYDSILFVVATVNGEKIFFWNSKLAKQVGSGSYVVQIDPQSFQDKARQLFSKAYAELRESIKCYNKLLKENKKQIIRLTESDLHNIIKESVNKILQEGKYVNNKPFFPKGENGEFYGPREFIAGEDEMNYSPEMLKSAFKHFNRADLAHIGLGPHDEQKDKEYRNLERNFRLQMLKNLKTLGLTLNDFKYLSDREIDNIYFDFDKIRKSPKLQKKIIDNVNKRKGI